MPEFDDTLLTFEWVMLGLRIAFIGLIYLFLYQISQVALRELVAIGRAEGSRSRGERHRVQASVTVLSPADSSLDRDARIPVSTYTTVGRSPDNVLVLDDSFTSGSHAELVREADGWSVHDLSSTNGTYVNDQQVYGPTPVESGDILRFGNVIVEFHN